METVSVHPRMRGERSAFVKAGPTCSGSSPHARGTRGTYLPEGRPIRFIPACVGNAFGGSHPDNLRAVHPRMRGERLTLAGLLLVVAGSSPHARGTQLLPFLVDPQNRFIPACAGNARLLGAMNGLYPVHPRMRGERASLRADMCSAFGSSPHARGTPNPQKNRGVIERFIPACAGNAGWQKFPRMWAAVHPRMRGERCAAQCVALPFFRFIPACAGNATGHRIRASVPPVHPRMRGERSP